MPKLQYLPEEADREAVRDWVLSVCMDASVDASLPEEAQAQGTIYAGLYASDLATCIVTGFPVAKRDEVHNNNSVANKRGELDRPVEARVVYFTTVLTKDTDDPYIPSLAAFPHLAAFICLCCTCRLESAREQDQEMSVDWKRRVARLVTVSNSLSLPGEQPSQEEWVSWSCGWGPPWGRAPCGTHCLVKSARSSMA